MRVATGKLYADAVLAALYNAARPQGMGFMAYDPKPMSTDGVCKKGLMGSILAADGYVDYLEGRVMKVRLSDVRGEDDSGFEAGSYDRDNGDGAAQAVIESLLATGDVNNAVIQAIHAGGTAA